MAGDGWGWLGWLVGWLVGWLADWLGLAWLGLAWLGLAWLGLAWLAVWLAGLPAGLPRLAFVSPANLRTNVLALVSS
ncbi:hypothetical protein K0M31_003908 [Melipona bicolor]|uniref:Uncharacterized protein n=1 Tax=Melipona bicolor TaxID=60889 RepID=A0AA40KP20_9HYME|nr:hypothetical protein K0M31_003908 [Melipona bicolor]